MGDLKARKIDDLDGRKAVYGHKHLADTVARGPRDRRTFVEVR